MKFTVEIEDFWMEGDKLEKELRDYIASNVFSQIWSSIQKKVDEEIRNSVEAIAKTEVTAKINRRLKEIMETEKFITRDKKEILIVDYIKQLFQDSHRWNNPTEVIENLAKTFGAEMKKRYDFVFASQIVKEMNTVGLLKDDVVAKLLEGAKS